MKNKSLSLFQFQQRYRSDADCLDAIAKARWPRGFNCPHCGHDDGYRLSNRPVFQCCCCRKQTSITAGTIFHKSRIPLTKWFLMMFLMVQDKGGSSALRMSKFLGMRYDTVWHIMHKLRLAMFDRDQSNTLTGFIEIDEGFFGGRSRGKGNRGRGSEKKVPVVVMVESLGSTCGNVVMRKVEKPNMECIKSVVLAHVDQDQRSWFRSDGWGAYGIVSAVDHQITSAPIPKTEMDSIHRCVHLAISLARRFLLGTYHGTGGQHLQRYLDEFCFRFNRKDAETTIFSSLLRAAAFVSPISYAALSG